MKVTVGAGDRKKVEDGVADMSVPPSFSLISSIGSPSSSG